MTNRAFRFGVVAGNASTAEAWTGLARRAEDLGYATLLQPDTLGTLSPFSALAAAVGRPFGAPAERVKLLTDTIAAVKAPRGSHVKAVQTPHPPVLVPAGGPKVTRIAVEQADIVTVAIAPTAGEEALAERVGTIKSYAGDRFDQLELSTNLLGIGTGEIPGRWSAEDLAGSASVLTGTVDEMVDTLRRRRDALGISYVSVNAAYIDRFAPVV